jgi:hypothetical protein
MLAGGGAHLALAQPATRSVEGDNVATADRPQYSRTREIPDRLLRPAQHTPVILPSQPGTVGEDPDRLSQGTRQAVTPDTPLLPEGFVLAGRECRITRDGKWYVVEPVQDKRLPESPPLRVLPNQQLELIEAVLTKEDRGNRYSVTGRVTEFLGANYVLVQHIEEVSTRTAPSTRPSDVSAGDQTTANVTETESDAEKPASDTREPTAEEIMQRLLEHRARRPLVLPERVTTVSPDDNDSRETDGEASPTGRRKQSWPEGALLIDTIGRILPTDDGWTFTFEDRGDEPAHPPIRLLPSRLLENAIAISAGGTRGTVFVVSGEITLHDGTNYLLLRKLLVRRDLGNFR